MNKFKSWRQCQWYKDRRGVGDSRIALLGPFTGGALELEDGRASDKQRQRHTYNGSKVPHGVQHFRGDRVSVVLDWDPVILQYVLAGSEPRAINPDDTQNSGHPAVQQSEDPSVVQERARAACRPAARIAVAGACACRFSPERATPGACRWLFELFAAEALHKIHLGFVFIVFGFAARLRGSRHP